MSFATLNRSDLSALKLEIGAAVYNGLQRFEDYRTYRRTLNELRRLNPRELADLGAHRSGIRSIAREAVYGV